MNTYDTIHRKEKFEFLVQVSMKLKYWGKLTLYFGLWEPKGGAIHFSPQVVIIDYTNSMKAKYSNVNK
jgi:hypothetical protein